MKTFSPSVPARPYLLKFLRDPSDAAAYLQVVLEEQDQHFLKRALRDVAEAQGGIARLAKKAGLNRVSLYRMLSDKGNPELSSLLKVIQALGMQLSVSPAKGAGAKAPKRARKGPLVAKRPSKKLALSRIKKAVSR